MTKTLFKKRNFITLFVFGALLGVFIACMSVSPMRELTLEQSFISARDGSDVIEYGEFSINLFFSTMNIVIFVPVITNFFSSDLEVAKSYVFSRTNNISKWYIPKILQIFVYCLFSQTVYNSFLLLTVYAMGFKAQNAVAVVEYLVFGIVVGFLILFLFTVLSCIISLKMQPHVSAIAVMFLVVFLSVFLHFAWNKYVMQADIMLYYYISIYFFDKVDPIILFKVYPAWVCYGVITLIAIAEIIAGSRILKKSDMI